MTNTAPVQPPQVTYVTSGRSDYSDVSTTCCGAPEHRPAGNVGGAWFCMDCGRKRTDAPQARKAN